jgi:hypothetical protein
VLETEQPDATVSRVDRVHEILAGGLRRWCTRCGLSKARTANLVAVRIADERGVCDTEAIPTSVPAESRPIRAQLKTPLLSR